MANARNFEWVDVYIKGEGYGEILRCKRKVVAMGTTWTLVAAEREGMGSQLKEESMARV